MFRAQARKERSKPPAPSGTEKEYRPRLPPSFLKPETAAPKAKKRAPILTARTGFGRSNSGSLSPITTTGLTIGDVNASYEDSDVVLDGGEGCADRITVCKPLASLLKKHQVEGITFCWRNVCSKLFAKEESNDIHGAVLAHNMGLGKSLQAVCLLHTALSM